MLADAPFVLGMSAYVALLGSLLVATVIILLVGAACRALEEKPGWKAALRPSYLLRLPRRPLPLPPEPDRAPPNLAPLLPTQRVVEREVSRGMRDLQLFLASESRD